MPQQHGQRCRTPLEPSGQLSAGEGASHWCGSSFIGGASINLCKLNDLEIELKEMKKNYATKDDLKEMKTEMKNYATKDDLEEMKTEMKNYATKDDLAKLRSDLQEDFQLFYTSAENAQLKERLAELSSKK